MATPTKAQQTATPALLQQAPFYILLVTIGVYWLALTTDIGYLFHVLTVISAISAITIYVMQVEYLRKVLSKKRTAQFALIAASILLPLLGSIFGDLQGAAAFGDQAEIGYHIISDLLLLLYISLYVVLACSIANALTILTKGTNRFLHALGYVMMTIAWFAITYCAYFTYSLTYALHDPSTE